MSKSCCQAQEKPRQRQVTIVRTQSQGIGERAPSHNILGTGLLSCPNLRVGLSLRIVMELSSMGSFRVEGRTI